MSVFKPHAHAQYEKLELVAGKGRWETLGTRMVLVFQSKSPERFHICFAVVFFGGEVYTVALRKLLGIFRFLDDDENENDIWLAVLGENTLKIYDPED